MAGITYPRIRVCYGQLLTAAVNTGTIVIPRSTPIVAEATITTTSVANTEYVVIDGFTYTAAATEALATRAFDYDSSDNDTATSLAACINHATGGLSLIHI